MIKLRAKKNIKLSSKNAMQITVKENDAQLSSNNGNIQLQSAKDIILMGSGNDAVTLQQGSNILQHTVDNQTIWRGKKITINAATINIYSNNALHNTMSSVQASGITSRTDIQADKITEKSTQAGKAASLGENSASSTIKNTQNKDKKSETDDA